MSKLLLIDGDIVAYRAAASCEPTKIKLEREPLDEAIFRANDLLYRIVDTCASSEYRLYLTGSGNFRKLLYPDYKANRARLPKPEHLDAVRELLVREWGASVCDGYEADDGIGMAHQECPETIVCSIDKDLRQLAGEHFNFVKNEFEVVDSLEASRAFYTQMLVGDTSDNVRGVDGIGPVKAGRHLSGLTPEQMHSTTFDLYGDPGRFFLNYRLLRVLRTKEEYEEIMSNIEQESYVENVVGESEGAQPTEASA